MQYHVPKLLLMANFLLVALLSYSCGNDENDKEDDNISFTGESLFERIKVNPDYSTFTQILMRAEYNTMLSRTGAMTVFAPTNEALSTNSNDLSDSLCLVFAKRFIVPQAKTISEFISNTNDVTNLLGETVSISVENGERKIVISSEKERITARISAVDMACANGYLNVLDEMKVEVLPNNTVVEESFWNTRADVIGVLNTCYYHCMQFESNQMKLEEIRTDKEKVHTINPQSSVLSDTYTSAYTVINTANLLLEHAPSVKQADASMSSEELDAILAETRSLRAFVYYNLAMLWGNVVLVDKPIMVDGFDYPAQSMQSEVYKFAYSDICYAIDKLPGTYNTEIETKARFTRNAALMLKAEIELAMGNSSEARSTIGKISDAVNFGFSNMEQNIIPIYTAKHLSLYEKEANRNTNGLEKEWASMPNGTYGFWSAIKRLGKAQEMTGCYDYELLMPFPLQDIIMNPKLRQNSGY